MAKVEKKDKGIKVVFVGAHTVKEINCSLGKFRVRKLDTGERFIRVDTQALADQFVAKYPKEFQGHTGTASLKRKRPVVEGVRTEGLDRGEVEDDGMDDEEKELAKQMSNPNADFRNIDLVPR